MKMKTDAENAPWRTVVTLIIKETKMKLATLKRRATAVIGIALGIALLLGISAFYDGQNPVDHPEDATSIPSPPGVLRLFFQS
jgi:hypothetical protein